MGGKRPFTKKTSGLSLHNQTCTFTAVTLLLQTSVPCSVESGAFSKHIPVREGCRPLGFAYSSIQQNPGLLPSASSPGPSLQGQPLLFSAVETLNLQGPRAMLTFHHNRGPSHWICVCKRLHGRIAAYRARRSSELARDPGRAAA